jgi:hypothetical protein
MPRPVFAAPTIFVAIFQPELDLPTVFLRQSEKPLSSTEENSGLKRSSLFSVPAISFFAAAIVAASAIAQTPQASPGAPPPPGAEPPHQYPAPTNLKVLPKNLTGEQIHEIMHEWSGGLGVRCGTCHAADPTREAPDGKPQLNYADDSKEEKLTARVMYQMLDDINAKYVSKVPNSDMPVTCGTCHRGNLDPEPYVIPKHPPQGPPPAGGALPPPHP